jgi:hypothetical protein
MTLFKECRLGALLAILSVSMVSPAIGQATRFDVTGVVVDSTSTPLQGATVMVLRSADSTLVGHAVTREDGSFRVTRIAAGSYLLQVTFVGFAGESRSFTIADRSVDVGFVRLVEATAELDELVVTSDHIPMVVRRDTLEYNAAAFRVRPNATVEDLLRRLPGIEVESDGTIRAQGETVRQVLVDGKEFFGNDPTVATRNLPADAVDRVQVYDRRSDVSEFTGVDDGQQARTINLALRPDRRQGYFGNATAGIGDVSRYEGRASVNRFNTRTQMSLLTNVNNINQQGFSINDYASFMGGIQNLMSEGGQISLANAPVSAGGPSNGFATTLSGGLNLNHDFSPRLSLRASYMVYHLDHDQDRSILQRQISAARGSSLTVQQIDQNTRNQNHRLNLNLKRIFGEAHDLQFRTNIQIGQMDLASSGFREAFNDQARLEHSVDRRYESSNESGNGDAVVTYRRRFSPGRSLVAEIRSALSGADLLGRLDALTTFYQAGDLLTYEEVAQLQEQASRTLSLGQRLTYTEPLGRRQLLQLDLEHREVREDQDRTVFDESALGRARNDALSSGFDRSYRYLRAGMNFRRAVQPFTLRIGMDVQQARLEGSISGTAGGVDRQFVRILPSAMLTYALAASQNLEFRYTASTREPSVRELQPFTDNSDPLALYTGNSDLRPEYIHSATARFLYFDQFSMSNFFAFVRGSYTLDKIVRARTIDAGLRQALTVENSDGDWSIAGNASFGRPVRPLGIRLNLGSQVFYNRGIELINAESNRAGILRSTLETRLENRNKDKFDFQGGLRLSFNDVRYSLNPALDTRYVNQTWFGEASYRLGAHGRLTTGLDYSVFSKEVFGEARFVPLWRAEVSRLVLKDRAELKLSIADILDRNQAVNYSNTSIYVQEERTSTLGRHVMLRFVYSLSGVRRAPGMIIQSIGAS